jgi:hypothetical protein
MPNRFRCCLLHLLLLQNFILVTDSEKTSKMETALDKEDPVRVVVVGQHHDGTATSKEAAAGGELLEHLDVSLVVQIVDFLNFFDGRRLLMSSPLLWAVVQQVESQRRELQLEPPMINDDDDWKYQSRQFGGFRSSSNFSYFRYLDHLQQLTLDCYASNYFLRAMATQNLMPSLQHLSMVSSEAVTSQGFMSLTEESADDDFFVKYRQPNLRYIDITFSPRISYESTLLVRARLQNGVVIRRQPSWMDGRFETNFDNDGIHSYWADGSFSYEREGASSGYVDEVFLWDETNQDHVGDKLQFTNFTPPATWPNWARFFYRPGVSLLRTPEEEGQEHEGSEGRTIIVAQLLAGMRPPRDYPQKQHRNLPVGVTQHFNLQGDLITEDDPDFRDHRHLIVTRMRVFPLESLMPPQEIVDQNSAFLRDYKRSLLDIESRGGAAAFEQILHDALGGTT